MRVSVLVLRASDSAVAHVFDVCLILTQGTSQGASNNTYWLNHYDNVVTREVTKKKRIPSINIHYPK